MYEVGSWVYINGKLKKIKEIIKAYYMTLPNIIITESDEYVLNCDVKITLWEPKEGDWCWFWNKNEGHPDFGPRLAQFMFKTEELQTPMDFPAFHITKYKPINYGYTYDFCEPFTGELPSIYKGL